MLNISEIKEYYGEDQKGECLIIVDMVNDFLSKQGVLFVPNAKPIVNNIKKLIYKYKNIIYLYDAHGFGDSEFDRFPEHCIAGTWGCETIPELDVINFNIKDIKDFHYVPKNTFSGFFNTSLDTILRTNKIKEITIVGVCTSICIMDTVAEAINRNYKVNVKEDCVADLNKTDHVHAIRRMKNIYGASII